MNARAAAGASNPSPARQGLARKLAYLDRPESYPGRPATVERRQTHMSVVFLVGASVYKLKKPYRDERIDYATPAARRRQCEREVRLNRRLAPDVYLGTVALVRDSHGRLALGGPGEPIDWLVHMRRLPDAGTLEHRLHSGRLRAADLRPVVALLARFFARAPRARLGPATYLRHLEEDIRTAAKVLSHPRIALAPVRVRRIEAALLRFTRCNADLLADRVRGGHIVDGHGDLRPEHVYLAPAPRVIDCIEFSRRLRQRDPLDELAFLASECDRLGHPEVDAWIFDAYRRHEPGLPPRTLIDFHKCRNAFIRAMLAARHLLDPDGGPRGKWRARARAHLRLCVAYGRRMLD